MDDELERSRNMFVAAMIVLGLLLGYVVWSRWPAQAVGAVDELALPYVDALALCAESGVAGAAKIQALDALNGEDARPGALRPDLARCLVDGALARVR